MKIESFVLKYYQQQCTPQPLHVPTMPEGNQAVMEAIRDEAIAIATKAQAEGNRALLRAISSVPTEFPELTKEIERLDAEILKVSSDQLKRPKHGPDMGKLVDFAKRINKTHVSDLLAECGDDQGALQALLEVVKGGDEHWVGTVEGKLGARSRLFAGSRPLLWFMLSPRYDEGPPGKAAPSLEQEALAGDLSRLPSPSGDKTTDSPRSLRPHRPPVYPPR